MVVDDLLADLRFGWRMLRRHPGFSIVAALALAIGIGANTAVFTVADALIFRPPPFEHSERLFWIYDVNPDLRLTATDTVPLSPANVLDWRARNRAFERIAAWRNWFFSVAPRLADARSGQAGDAEQVRGVNVSPAFFEMLGVRAALGRTFLPDDEEPGRDQIAVLTAGFWQRRFGGDPNIVGTTVLVDGRPFTVVGVLPADFYFLFPDSAIFMPMKVDPVFRRQRDTHSIGAMVKLAPGLTRAAAQADLDRVARELEQEHPSTNRGWSGALVPVFPLNRNLRPALLVLVAAVACVLLIACINVASLLVVRAGVRQREMAVRVAVGASRGRLVRQTLAESALLAAIGAAGGVALAAAGLRLLTTLIPQVQISRPLTMTIDGRVLAFTLVSAAATAAALGILPALRSPRTEALTSAVQTARGAGAGRVLVATEIALSLMLLVAATLLVRSLWNLRRVDPGFHAEHLLTMQLWLPPEKYASPERIAAFHQEMLRRVSQLPDVRAAAIVNTRPFLGWGLGATLEIPGQPPRPNGDYPIVGCRVISAGYLVALGTPLVRGRGLTDGDAPGAAPVALINETMARRFWPGEDPIGKTLRIERANGRPVDDVDGYPQVTVVGVARDVVSGLLVDGEDAGHIYLPTHAADAHATALLLRARSPRDLPPHVLRDIYRRVVADPDVFETVPLDEIKAAQVYPLQAASWIGSVLGAIALVLSVSGLYGVLAYMLNQRTKDIGIRMALGATAGAIIRLVMAQSARMAVVGIAVAVIVAGIAMKALSAIVRLQEVSFLDATAFVIGIAVVLIATALATWSPARRATKVDPAHALRADG